MKLRPKRPSAPPKSVPASSPTEDPLAAIVHPVVSTPSDDEAGRLFTPLFPHLERIAHDVLKRARPKVEVDFPNGDDYFHVFTVLRRGKWDPAQGTITSWLWKVFFRRLQTQIRREASRRRKLRQVVLLAHTVRDPSVLTEHAEVVAALPGLMDTLPPRQRLVLYVRMGYFDLDLFAGHGPRWIQEYNALVKRLVPSTLPSPDYRDEQNDDSQRIAILARDLGVTERTVIADLSRGLNRLVQRLLRQFPDLNGKLTKKRDRARSSGVPQR